MGYLVVFGALFIGYIWARSYLGVVLDVLAVVSVAIVVYMNVIKPKKEKKKRIHRVQLQEEEAGYIVNGYAAISYRDRAHDVLTRTGYLFDHLLKKKQDYLITLFTVLFERGVSENICPPLMKTKSLYNYVITTQNKQDVDIETDILPYDENGFPIKNGSEIKPSYFDIDFENLRADILLEIKKEDYKKDYGLASHEFIITRLNTVLSDVKGGHLAEIGTEEYKMYRFITQLYIPQYVNHMRAVGEDIANRLERLAQIALSVLTETEKEEKDDTYYGEYRCDLYQVAPDPDAFIKQVLRLEIGYIDLQKKESDRVFNEHHPAYHTLSTEKIFSQFITGSYIEHLIKLSVWSPVPWDIRYEHTHIVGGSGHGKNPTSTNTD